MKILRIRGRAFACLEEFDLELPECGIVLVTGENGHGKSAAFVEAISMGLWKQTVRSFDRGTGPWRDGGRLEVHAKLSDGRDLVIDRTSEALSWRLNSESVAYETASKAQVSLERIIGPHLTWVRSCLVDANQTIGFASANDRERKQLLESLLGTELFDEAEEKCRSDLKKIAESLIGHKQAYARLQERIAATDRAVLEFDEQLAGLGSTTAKQVETAIEEAQYALVTIQEARKLREIEAADLRHQHAKYLAMWNAEIKATGERVRELQSSIRKAVCPTCKRAFEESDAVEALQSELEASDRALTSLRTAPPREAHEIDTTELQEREDTLIKQIRRLEGVLTAAKLREQVLAQRDLRIRERIALRVDLEDTDLEVSSAELDLKIQKACEVVLGPRGARSILLSEAVSALEPLTNSWLARLGKLRVQIRPFKQKKDGGAVDTISLSVDGAGSPGYGGCSGGQQRRVDVAVALALADMARGAARRFDLLVLDEATDSPLDREGVEGLLGVVEELAIDRQIIVITHSQIVIDYLKTRSTWYRALHGRVDRVS